MAEREWRNWSEPAMSLRIIMVPLFDVDADDTALAAAFTIARRFDAHVVGLFVRPDLRSAAPVTGEGGSRTVMGDPVIHVIEPRLSAVATTPGPASRPRAPQLGFHAWTRSSASARVRRSGARWADYTRT